MSVYCGFCNVKQAY